jgi:integrase
VFTGANGSLHRRNNFRRRFWQPALIGNAERGWKPIQTEMHFHDLRHTHETSYDGVPPNMVQRVMGHERSSTTLDLYTRRTDNGDRILQALTVPDEEPGDGEALAPS